MIKEGLVQSAKDWQLRHDINIILLSLLLYPRLLVRPRGTASSYPGFLIECLKYPLRRVLV